MGYERNLVLVHTLHLQARSDFEAVQAKLATAAPDIEVFVVNNDARQSVTRREASSRPSLIFSPVPLRKFRPLRGKVYAGHVHSKHDQVVRLNAVGVRSPDAMLLQKDTHLDPATWGPFTVLKPNAGSGGKGVSLQRTVDVRWIDPMSWPKDDPRHGVTLIAQRFIDTGTHTTCHRVTTVFGRPISSTTSRWLEPRPFLLDPTVPLPGDQPIAANHGERTVTLNFDTDILEFGSRVAAVYPETPVLGVDVVREAASGDFYALEVNAGGYVWHHSSNAGIAMQKLRGIDLATQFGAMDIVADALVEVTRREAA